MAKSGTETWDLGREDSGTPGRGDVGLEAVGTCDSGTWDSRTRGCGTRGCGDAGLRDAGTSGRKDVINKQHLNFALNLQFTIFGGQEKGMMKSLLVADDFQRPWSP